ncbi:hypothetical protein DYH55_15315 [Methylovirgula sp. 4M-Z18]|nr:hypothetical protein DYH55_15315 [Methylovirgula sp. 4M-Z18]
MRVNHYVSIGETAAIAELRKPENEKDLELGPILWPGNKFTFCYATHEHEGGPLFLPGSMGDLAQLPYFPYAQSGSSFFLLASGWVLAGVPFNFRYDDIIKYCQEREPFRTNLLSIPTKEQAKQDALALRQSNMWKKLFAHSGEVNGGNESRTWGFVQLQVNAIK